MILFRSLEIRVKSAPVKLNTDKMFLLNLGFCTVRDFKNNISCGSGHGVLKNIRIK